MNIEIYDTTLRDGSQQEGISLTVSDKLAVARLLDELGVAFVEGGWPGANPKDTEFFARARTELDLSTACLTAFGSTRTSRHRSSPRSTAASLDRGGDGSGLPGGKSFVLSGSHSAGCR